MRKLVMYALCGAFLLGGCAASSVSDDGTAAVTDEAASGDAVRISPASPGGKTNAFNPYMRQSLPNTRALSADGNKVVGAMGGRAQSIEGEAAHRPHWRQEIYPVVWGNPKAPHEILVLLDFAAPQSEKIWQAVTSASRSLPAQQSKIVVFANSSENYGTDLMGLAIWISYSRQGQAMPYLTHALDRWNQVKSEQRKQGNVKAFRHEYDATAKASDYPIHYAYFSMLQPPVPASQELAVGKYCYDAGNVNLYQTVQLCRYYGLKNLPAVIVDGKVLSSVSAQSIIAAMK